MKPLTPLSLVILVWGPLALATVVTIVAARFAPASVAMVLAAVCALTFLPLLALLTWPAASREARDDVTSIKKRQRWIDLLVSRAGPLCMGYLIACYFIFVVESRVVSLVLGVVSLAVVLSGSVARIALLGRRRRPDP